MRQFFLKLAMSFCILLGPQLAMAGPADDARGVLTKWEKAFNAGDVDGVAGLYTPDATLFGTMNPALTSGTAGLKAYFAASLKNKTQVKFADAPTVTKVTDSVFVLSGVYDFSGTRADGQKFSTPARYSFLVAKVAGQWRIMHQHSSPRPASS